VNPQKFTLRNEIDRMTGRSRGFAFIDMGSETDARKAIKQMDGKSLEDKEISVKEARPRESRPRPRR